MKRILIHFLILFILFFSGCEDDPSLNEPRLTQIIVDDTGKDYYRYDFIYEGDKLTSIEHWYNDRYWYDSTDNWSKGSNGVEFSWSGDLLKRIVWNYRTSTQTVSIDHKLTGDIEVTRTRVLYEYPTEMHQRSEEWAYDDDRLQCITITENLTDLPDVYDLTWSSGEITQVIKTGDHDWKWVFETGSIGSPFKEALPRKYRQMFLFHHEGFYDSDGVLTWSEDHIPLRIKEIDLENPEDPTEKELTGGYSFISNEQDLLYKMQIEEVTYEYYYE
jgi:hypothetical protein